MRLAFIGDVMLGRLVNDLLRRAPGAYPWGDTLPWLGQADCRLCNLECVIANRLPALLPPKTFHFRSDGKNVAVLEAAGIDAVSLANNHTLDYGEAAMVEMLRRLDQAGIARAGAGRTAEEAAAPAIWRLGDLQIGLVACTDNEPAWAAGSAYPGIFYVPVDARSVEARALLDLVSRTSRQVDLLVASLHWGGNRGYRPPRKHRELAAALIEAGAGVVYGHSAHVCRGVEVREGRPILYSTGDFVDDYSVDPVERNDESFIFILETAGRVPTRLRLLPTVIDGCQARQAPAYLAEAMLGKMRRLCADMGTELEMSGNEGVIRLAT